MKLCDGVYPRHRGDSYTTRAHAHLVLHPEMDVPKSPLRSLTRWDDSQEPMGQMMNHLDEEVQRHAQNITRTGHLEHHPAAPPLWGPPHDGRTRHPHHRPARLTTMKPITTTSDLEKLPPKTILKSAAGSALQITTTNRVACAVARIDYTFNQAIGFFAPMTVLDTPKEP